MGGGLSTPITNLHIERTFFPFVRAGVVSMQGWRPDMEDAHNIALKLNETNMMLFGVYDGHGGSKCAEYLGKCLVDSFRGLKTFDADGDEKIISDILLKIDADYLSSGDASGATCTLVFAQPMLDGEAVINSSDLDTSFLSQPGAKIKIMSVNIGDSRSMIVRRDKKDGAVDYVEMTRDHKPDDEKERARIIAAGGHVSGCRVDGNLALSRAFGDSAYKSNVSLPPTQQKVIVTPEFKHDFLSVGDTLLITCDGIFEAETMNWENVANVTYQALQNTEDPAVVCRDIIETSLYEDSRDNHTAMVVTFASPDAIKTLPAVECVPMNYQDYEHDQEFIKAVKADFVANKVDVAEMKELAAKIEANEEITSVRQIKPLPAAPTQGGAYGGVATDPDLMDELLQYLYYKEKRDAGDK